VPTDKNDWDRARAEHKGRIPDLFAHKDGRILVSRREALLAAAAGDLFRKTVTAHVKASGRCNVALSGGHTPKLLFRRFIEREMRDWDLWPRLRVFWADERAVMPTHRDSNYRLAYDAFLSQVPVSMENIHRMRAEVMDLEAEARRYEELLEPLRVGEWPRLDLILLGLGADGHTASLFPRSPALDETGRWVVPAPGPEPHTRRLTLTLPVINAAATVCFLVTGADKARAVKKAIRGGEDFREIPAAGVRPVDGEVRWLLDESAASMLKESDL
jgi:6-phosphogluconolactonase